MTVDEFRAARAPAWAELARLAEQSDKRRRADQAMRLSRLHREAVVDLATARRRWPGEAVVDALEELVAASHAAVVAPSRGDRTHLLDWLRRGCWDAMAETLPWVWASTAFFLLAAAGGASWVAADPDAGGRLVTVSRRRDIIAGAWEVPLGLLAGVVGMAAGAAGVVGAGVLLAWTGLEFGAAFALAVQQGDDVRALSVVASATPLLTAVLFATGAGVHAGWALVQGDGAAWRVRFATAAQILATLAPLFVVGAWFRDVSSESAITTPSALVVAAVWWVLVHHARARALRSK